MEVILNLCWVLSAALLFWAGRSAAAGCGSRPKGSAWFTKLCLLALLFPVISLTDDLHRARLLSYRLDPGSRHHRRDRVRAAEDPGDCAHVSPALLPQPIAQPPAASAVRSVVAETATAIAGCPVSTPSRSPPLPLLG